MKRNAMKFATSIAASLAATFAFASGGGLPFNHMNRSLGKDDIRAGLVTVAAINPNVKDFYAEVFKDQDWDRPGNLAVGGTRYVEAGQQFTNSYVDAKGRCFQVPDTAEARVELVLVICLSTNEAVWTKRDCLNLAGKAVPGAAVVPRDVEQVTDVKQALDLDIEIKLSATASATATASTAAITNNMVMYMPQQQPVYMNGNNPFQFVKVVQPGLTIGAGYCWTRPSSITVNSTNININPIDIKNENNNSNSNGNVNNNNLKVGGGGKGKGK